MVIFVIVVSVMSNHTGVVFYRMVHTSCDFISSDELEFLQGGVRPCTMLSLDNPRNIRDVHRERMKKYWADFEEWKNNSQGILQ